MCWAILSRSIVATMKAGDIIRRKDIPTIQVRIIGDNPTLRAWDVELIGQLEGFDTKASIVYKDDIRWELCNTGGSNETKEIRAVQKKFPLF